MISSYGQRAAAPAPASSAQWVFASIQAAAPAYARPAASPPSSPPPLDQPVPAAHVLHRCRPPTDHPAAQWAAHAFPSVRRLAPADQGATGLAAPLNAALTAAAAAAFYQFPDPNHVAPSSVAHMRDMPPPKRTREDTFDAPPSRSISFDSSRGSTSFDSVGSDPALAAQSGTGVVAGTLRFLPRMSTASSSAGCTDYDEDASGSVVLKRRRLSGDERQQRSRERNRMHAKKTRLRKKQQMDALAHRVQGLEREGAALRQAVDDRRTAYILLGIGGGDGGDPFSDQALEAGMLASAAPLADGSSPRDRAESGLDGAEDDDLGGEDEDEGADGLPGPGGEGEGDDGEKRTRRRGKYSAAERELIRRERNRMHAKKTRDRKRLFVEEAEVRIGRLARGAWHLRAVMARHGLGDAARAVPRAPPLVTPTDEELTRALLADEGSPSSGPSSRQSSGDGRGSATDAAGATDESDAGHSPRPLGNRAENEN